MCGHHRPHRALPCDDNSGRRLHGKVNAHAGAKLSHFRNRIAARLIGGSGQAHIAELELDRNNTQPSDIAELEAELTSARKERDDAVGRYWQIRTYAELRTEGVFTRKEFNKVRSLLHPDRVQDGAERKRYAEAFDIFSRCEKLLKKEPLPAPPPMATTREELMGARLRVMRENRARGLKAAATRRGKNRGDNYRSNNPY
jgi:hypothetical protein